MVSRAWSIWNFLHVCLRLLFFSSESVKKKLSLPWEQERTRRRGYCWTACWLSGIQNNSSHLLQEVFQPNSASWLEWQRINTQRCWDKSCWFWGVLVFEVTFIYSALLQVRSEEQRRAGVIPRLQTAHALRLSAEKRREAPGVKGLHADPE